MTAHSPVTTHTAKQPNITTATRSWGQLYRSSCHSDTSVLKGRMITEICGISGVQSRAE